MRRFRIDKYNANKDSLSKNGSALYTKPNKYNTNKDSLSKNGSALYMNPMFSAIFCVRDFVFFPLLIVNVAREGMLYFFPDLWNNENWVFLN